LLAVTIVYQYWEMLQKETSASGSSSSMFVDA
jgi:hypothetical protein